jgi:hypothetical protein
MNQIKWLAACGLVTTITLFSALAPQARAAAPANDNPCNSGTNIYNNLNTGTGFAAWTGVSGSFYYGGSGMSGDACSGHDWGMYDSGGVTTCQRPFTAANGVTSLQVGQTITNDMENGGVQNGDTEGLSLWNASGQNVFEMYFIGGGNYWTVADGSGTSTNDAIPYAGSGCRVIFTLTSSTTYSLTVYVAIGGTKHGPFTGTLSNPSGGQAITQLRWFTSNIGGGNNLQVGQMEVTCPDALTLTEQPVSESVPTNQVAVFTVATTGDTVNYQWQSSSTSNGTYTAISGATFESTINATNYESSYAVAATTANNGTWYRCVATDACSNTVTSGAAQLTLSPATAPVITTQPANTTVCSNSAATFSVTASGTTPGYDWLQHANAGWGSGSAWSVVASNAGSGVYVGSSTNNDGIQADCTGFNSTGDINSPSGSALGMYGPKIAVQRVFPGTLSQGQWFSIDMDNGNVDTGAQNGFALHTGLPNTNGFLLSFYFFGGHANYKFSDATGEHDTGIAFTRTGLRVQMLVGSAVGGTNTYSLFLSTNQCGAATALTNVFSGTFATNGPPGAVVLFNNDASGGSTNDLFFNNIIAGGAYDNAGNYNAPTNWANGGNGGDLPITGATSASDTVNNADSNSVPYYVIVTNAVGAVVSSTGTLTINALPTLYTVGGGGGYCSGGSGVAVTLSGSASGVTYYLQLGGSNTGATLAGTGSSLSFNNVTAAGTYTILASNTTTGCTQAMTGTTTVTINAIPTFTYTSQNNTQCGGTNGSITVTASGGSGSGYQYSDNNGSTYQSSNVFTGLVSGAYEVVVKDSNGCVSSATMVTISDPNGPSFTYGQVNETCNGQSIGSITVTASGGSGGYQYSDNNGSSYQSGNTFSGLAAGSYTIVVEDSNGCKSGGQIVTITQPSAVTFTTSHGNVSCYGGANGSLTVTASGGSGSGYQYSDNNGSSFQSGNAFSGLSAATYEIVVKDGNGCLSSATGVTITQPSSALSCSVAPSSATVCAGSSQTVTASASGGTAGYSYSWTGPNSFSASTAAITINNAQPANAGTYTCTVTDANGCTSQCTATLTVNSAPSISASPTNLTVCSDSTAQFNVTASGTSLQYFWRQRGSGWGATDGWTINTSNSSIASNGTFIGDSSLNSGGSGTHSNINSSAGTAFGLYANTGASVDAYRPFGSLAVGQTIQVDIENGYISSGGSSVGFGIENSIGTNLWEFFFVGGNSDYTLNDGTGANATTIPFTANGLRITFTLTSSNTYSATIVTPATGGSTYTFSGTLITPFSGTQVPAQLHFWNANAGDGCLGSNCTPYDYFFNNLYVGGVPGTASVALYSDDASNYSSLGTGNNYGQGPIANVLPGATEFSGVNTATLTIDPATSIDASNYDVVVTNSCGAARCNAALLTVDALPNIYNVTGGGAYCAGGSGVAVTLSGSASNIAYCLLLGGSSTGTNWTGTGSALGTNVTAAGAYTILASNTTTGCAQLMGGTATVTINALPTFSYSQANVTCNGGANGSITVTASGGSGSGYTYSDNNGSTYQSGNAFSGLAAGSYTVVVEDGNGCTSGGQVVTITQPSAVTFTTGQANVTCNGGANGSITVTASGGSGTGYQYSDNGGSTFQSGNTFSGLATGTYQIVVEDGNGCLSATTPVTITQPAVLSCSVSPSIVTNCTGSSQSFTVSVSGGTPGYTYLWSDGSTGTSITTNAAGTYSVTVTDTNGCTSTCTATLTLNVAPSISIEPTNIAVCAGSSTSLSVTASGSPLNYVWRKLGSGWGAGGWSFTNSGAASSEFLDSSTNNDSGDTASNGGNDIDTGGQAWALINNGGVAGARRPFNTPLAVGQTFAIDMDNGNVQSGGTVGFGLQNTANDNNRLDVFFVGGSNDYTVSDNAGPNDSGIGFTRTGIHCEITLTSTDTYSITIIRYAGSVTAETNTLTGTLKGTAGTVIDRLQLFNANAGDCGVGCDTDTLYFNNISFGCNDDNAGNYTNWVAGSDLGQGPLANGGDVSGATTATLTINPASTNDAGGYDVFVTNSCGVAISSNATVTVSSLPTQYTVSGGGAYCSGGSGVSVTLSNSDIGVNYQLELDGSPAGSPVAGTGGTLTFSNQTAAGTYTIVADNATAGCSSIIMSGSATVTINPTPSCSVSPASAAVCAGGSQTFTVNPSGGTPGYTYLWSDGSTGSTLTTNTAGTYSVTVTDSNGCTTTCSATLTVNPLPTVSVNSSAICAGGSTILTATTGASAPNYLWSPGGATTASITVSPASTTIYTVTVTDGSTGCANSGSGTVTVNPLPATPTAGNNGPICAGSTLNLSTPTVAGATYSWTGPNSFVSSQQNPSISNATTAVSGTYLVTITDSNGCTSAAGSTSATVNPNPSTPTASNNGPIIEGNTLNLTASTVDNTTYSWTGPNGFASTNQNPSISNATSAASGVYLVTVTDSNGCTSAAGSTTALVTALQITSITTQGGDILITWLTTGGTTNAVQATPGNPGYNTNFVDISGPLLILGSGDTSTNYVDVGAATNSPAKFYRVRLVP